MSFVTSTSSSAITRISMPSTDITSPRSIRASSTGMPFGCEDQIDERVAVPGLDQPLLGRVLGAQPGLLQRRDRALDVLGLDHQIEVVPRLRAAARPAREAAAEQERDVGRAQRGGGLLQASSRSEKGCSSSVAMGSWLPAARERVCGNAMSSTVAIDGRPADRRDECRIRIAAAGDIHYGERADDRERASGRVRCARGPRRPAPAGRRPDHARRARAGADRRRRGARPRRPGAHRARQPRLARQPRRTSSPPCSRTRA